MGAEESEGRKPLTAKRIEKLPIPAHGKKRYADGVVPRLFVVVTSKGRKYFACRCNVRGSGIAREIVLGDARVLTVEQARRRGIELAAQVAAGRDPKAEQDRERRAAKSVAAARGVTFAQVTRDFVTSHTPGWNSKEPRQWSSEMDRYASRFLSHLHPRDIAVQQVLDVLRQPSDGGRALWDVKPKLANRLRSKIERVLNYAEAAELRSGANPASWKRLRALLPDPKKLAVTEHRAALDYRDIPQFMVELEKVEGVPAAALQVLVLTALRTREVTHARWAEIDMAAKIWTIPAARMKGRKEHRVPLTDAVMNILCALPHEQRSDFIFVGTQPGKPIGKNQMIRVLQSLRLGITVHGFRSSFRDWAGETTSYPRELAEMALAHALEGGATEQAYARGDMLERRRELMAAWANHCRPVAESEKVVALRA
jgi:integrase